MNMRASSQGLMRRTVAWRRVLTITPRTVWSATTTGEPPRASSTTTGSSTSSRTSTTALPTSQANYPRSLLFIRNLTTSTAAGTVDLNVFLERIHECLHKEENPDLAAAQEAYHDWKAAARQLGPTVDDRWKGVRQELFQAWIAQSEVEALDPAALVAAVSHAHEILEDRDERLGLHALTIQPKEEEAEEETSSTIGSGNAVVDDVLGQDMPFDQTPVFDDALLVLHAWARAAYTLKVAATVHDHPTVLQRLSRGIPQRAQFLLQQLEQHSTSDVPPAYYEAVLQTWASSPEHLRGIQAEKVLGRMCTLSAPALHWIIRAWAWSREPRAAFTATGHLMKRLRYHSYHVNDGPKGEAEEQQMEDGMSMEPGLEDYEIIFDAWTRAEDKMSPTKAFSLWTLWQTSIEEDITSVKPSLAVYRSLLQTATARPSQPSLGRRVVDVLLARMKEELIIPDTVCYEASLRVWKHCALHPDVPEDRQACLRRITDLLAEMRSAHRRSSSTDGSTGVTTTVLNHVIESLQVSQHSQRGAQAETFLREMEVSLGQPKFEALPNTDSYRFVLDVYRSTTSRDRIPLAKAVLWRCKDNLLRDSVSPAVRKNAVEVLNGFVHICTTTPLPVAGEEGVLILREALSAVERFRSDCNVAPNQNTYTHLLQAARELLSSSPKRTKIVDQIFRMACQDGMVDDVLLQQLMQVATQEQYHHLIVVSSETVDDVKVIPEEWSRSVLGGRVVSADGRRVKPVTIDGRLTETKSMKEFKMRRLRDGRNRSLLQGGRWDRRQDEVQA